MKLTAIMWAALAVVVGISLFMLKYEVQGLEDQLQATYAQIEKDKTAIRVLEAEWTYLNDPGRLRRLSAQYLGFTPPAASQVLTVSQLPFKNGEAPAFEGVSTPPAKPIEVPLTGLREARDTSADVQPVALTAETPFNAKDAISARLAQLQRLLPATWTIQPVNAAVTQEPLR
jgi:cell division protein FtsL